MATNPTFQLSLLAFPQGFDGANLRLRILVLPQGDPLSPLLTGAPPAPDSPAFADARPKFVVELIPSLDALPAPASTTGHVALATTAPTQARTLFQYLATQFNIAPDPPGQTPRRSGYRTRKFLPGSYRNAFAFDRPRTPFAVTDDTYHCMLENPVVKQPQPPPPSTVSWGRVIAFALRQPALAQALGLLYEASFALPTPDTFADGGWLYVGLDPAGDFSAQVAVKPDLLQSYAARIPPLSAARPLFAAVLFPVLAAPSGSYDAIFIEAEDYDDGFAKVVHGAQPDRAALLDTSADGLPPSADFGLRLGWEDEQVAIWLNRQLDPNQPDAPLGVSGYRIDVRAHGATAWHSLCRVQANLALGPTSLGPFDGELGVETNALRHDPSQPGEWWLPSYFAQWRGRSVVIADPVALQLHGTDPSAGQPYTAVGDTDVALRYGQTYDLRVRLMDLSRGGPAVGDEAINPSPAPVAVVPFRRFVPFKPVTVNHLDQSNNPASPQTMYEIARPLLNYPAAVFAGVPNAVAALLADLPAAGAAGREAALPDPDAVKLSIEVQVRQLAMDAAIFVPSSDDHEAFSLLYATERDFPSDPSQPLQLQVSFVDIADIATMPPQPSSGPLVLPRARDIRLVLRAAAAPDPQLLYWGSTEAASGQTIELLTRANGADERNLFVPDIAANRIRGILLQPDPVPTSNLAAQLAVLGAGGTTTSDLVSRLAQALSLAVSGLTLSGRAGHRVVFGCSAALRHTLSPEHGGITFAAKSELTQHWLIAITLRLARDWSWDGLAPTSFEVRDGASNLVGTIDVNDGIGLAALDHPDRSGTDLIFFDAVDPKPAAGSFPAELNLTYTVTPKLAYTPAQQDAPLSLSLHLPIAAKPTQTPQLASAGIALSPYAAAPDYSATAARQRALWLEFSEPIDDPDDMYFARVLSYAPDQMLTGVPFRDPGGIDPPPEPPLPIDPELIRLIVPGQSDDHAGLDAMQPLVPAAGSNRHFMLPLPAGLAVDAPELLGFFVYELRVGHAVRWSTAQGRFGPPLRVAGVQHPAPPLLCQVSSLPAEITVTAPYATPVFNGRNLLPLPPRTQLWALLYAQVTQADGASQRNVLLDRRIATDAVPKLSEWQREEMEPLEIFLTSRRIAFEPAYPISLERLARGTAITLWERWEVEIFLASLALPAKTPLSVLVVETLPDLGNLDDPLGGDLGRVRILRASPLTPIPGIC